MEWRGQGHMLRSSNWKSLSCDVVTHQGRDVGESCSSATQGISLRVAANPHVHKTTGRPVEVITYLILNSGESYEFIRYKDQKHRIPI